MPVTVLGEDLTDLTQILRILAAPDLKALAKSFHLNIAGATKKQIVEMLLKKSQQSSISAMFKGGTAVSTEKTMLTRLVIIALDGRGIQANIFLISPRKYILWVLGTH